MKTQHTPGPWETQDNGLTVFWRHQPDPDSLPRLYRVAECITTKQFDEEARANARLIAAAPELLEALEKAISYLETNRPKGKIRDIFSQLNEHENGVLKPARAAIAKATTP